jgi:hypothetical protein
MDPFKHMRNTALHTRSPATTAGVIAKASKARQARWERENRLSHRRQDSATHPDLVAIDSVREWLGFALFVGLFLAVVVGAISIHL